MKIYAQSSFVRSFVLRSDRRMKTKSEVVVVMKKNEQYYNATFGAVTMFALLA